MSLHLGAVSCLAKAGMSSCLTTKTRFALNEEVRKNSLVRSSCLYRGDIDFRFMAWPCSRRNDDFTDGLRSRPETSIHNSHSCCPIHFSFRSLILAVEKFILKSHLDIVECIVCFKQKGAYYEQIDNSDFGVFVGPVRGLDCSHSGLSHNSRLRQRPERLVLEVCWTKWMTDRLSAKEGHYFFFIRANFARADLRKSLSAVSWERRSSSLEILSIANKVSGFLIQSDLIIIISYKNNPIPDLL